MTSKKHNVQQNARCISGHSCLVRTLLNARLSIFVGRLFHWIGFPEFGFPDPFVTYRTKSACYISVISWWDGQGAMGKNWLWWCVKGTSRRERNWNYQNRCGNPRTISYGVIAKWKKSIMGVSVFSKNLLNIDISNYCRFSIFQNLIRPYVLSTYMIWGTGWNAMRWDGIRWRVSGKALINVNTQ